MKEAIITLLNRTEGPSFCRVWNAIGHMQKRSRNIEFVANGLYRSVFDNTKVYYSEKIRAKRGYKEEIIALGKTYFLDLIEYSPGDNIVDCGANVGEIGVYFQLTDRIINYYAFEPSSREFQCLKLNNPNGILHNIGLWHRKDTLKFYIKSDTADSSLFDIGTYKNSVEVNVDRMDNVLSLPRIKLMKIEAEGGEPEVLAGAEKLLPVTEYITVDCGAERGAAQAETLPDVVNFLTRNNFDLVKVSHGRIIALFKNRNLEELP